MNDFRVIGSPLSPGKVSTIIRETSSEAGTRTVQFAIDSESVLVSLFVGSIGAGTLDVVVYTQTEDGHEKAIITFPTVSGPTLELLMRKAALAMGVIRVVATSTALATFEIRAKAINSAGESSVKILGSADWEVSQVDIPPVATQLIPTSLDDRSGLVFKNYSTADVLYVAEIAAKATTAIGYPIGPGESLAMDLAGGQEIWGISGGGTIDVRIAQAGG